MPTRSALSRTVLLITARADHGGGPRHVLDLLKEFQGSHFEFFIAAPDQEPYGPKFKALTNETVTIPPRAFSFKAFLKIWELVQREKIDIVHSHGRGAGLYSRPLGLLMRLARFTCQKLTWLIQDLPEIHVPEIVHTFHGIHREKTPIGRLKLAIDQLLSYIDFTPIFVSQSERGDAWKYHCARESQEGPVIENAIDFTRFVGRNRLAFKSDSKDSATRKLIKIGTFLRPDPTKGPDRFLNFVRDNRNLGHFSCVGITKDELGTFGEVPAWLDVLGRIDEPASWLQDLDVYVSTARNEGLPLGVLEAMASGCLCVLSEIPAHRDFKMTKSALLYDPSKPETLAREIEFLKNDSALRDTLLKNARILIHSRHSLDVFKEKLAGVYNREP
jgi:glycosyltransferase involved in cell wall biosynthesis